VTVSEAESEVFAPASIAPQFVEARLKGVSVPGYPGGVLPKSMADGYAVQDLAIDHVARRAGRLEGRPGSPAAPRTPGRRALGRLHLQDQGLDRGPRAHPLPRHRRRLHRRRGRVHHPPGQGRSGRQDRMDRRGSRRLCGRADRRHRDRRQPAGHHQPARARPSSPRTSATTTARSWARLSRTGATSPGKTCRPKPSSTAFRWARAARSRSRARRWRPWPSCWATSPRAAAR
jgi:hypothetical protein